MCVNVADSLMKDHPHERPYYALFKGDSEKRNITGPVGGNVIIIIKQKMLSSLLKIHV